MSSTSIAMRPWRDRRRHIMAVLFTEHGVPTGQIAAAAGITYSTCKWQIEAHFAQHCAVCRGEIEVAWDAVRAERMHPNGLD